LFLIVQWGTFYVKVCSNKRLYSTVNFHSISIIVRSSDVTVTSDHRGVTEETATGHIWPTW